MESEAAKKAKEAYRTRVSEGGRTRRATGEIPRTTTPSRPSAAVLGRTCYNCGQPGHMVGTARTRRPASAASATTPSRQSLRRRLPKVRNCGQLGHISRDCPNAGSRGRRSSLLSGACLPPTAKPATAAARRGGPRRTAPTRRTAAAAARDALLPRHRRPAGIFQAFPQRSPGGARRRLRRRRLLAQVPCRAPSLATSVVALSSAASLGLPWLASAPALGPRLDRPLGLVGPSSIVVLLGPGTPLGHQPPRPPRPVQPLGPRPPRRSPQAPRRRRVHGVISTQDPAAVTRSCSVARVSPSPAPCHRRAPPGRCPPSGRRATGPGELLKYPFLRLVAASFSCGARIAAKDAKPASTPAVTAAPMKTPHLQRSRRRACAPPVFWSGLSRSSSCSSRP